MRSTLSGGTVAVFLVAAVAGAAETGYLSQPALHGERLVFVSEGDLWTVTLPPSGDAPLIAYRLTSSDGEESRPALGPEGDWIAFTGQYDGNTDVYVMRADGGAPKRLTFHPDPDEDLAWSADGRSVLFRSGRAHPLGRPELWEVPAAGGTERPSGFGECSLVAVSPVGRRIAFTRWSNEDWTWKRYRGGAAPDIWLGDLAAGQFQRITDHAANDLHPMWVLGRIFFVSDRTGTANIFSTAADGGDLKQHTEFAPDPKDPAAPQGHDVRWPSADAQKRGRHIVFAQAGGLCLLDTAGDAVRRLDVRLASDRPALRRRFADPMRTATEYALSPEATQLVLGTRGEILVVPLDGRPPRQLPSTSFAREWGASFLDEDQLVLITDATGEQQVAVAPADGSSFPNPLTDDREAWLFPPAGSPDGAWVAFGEKTQRLHVLSMQTLERRQVDQSEAWEITDYRFSPDGQWLAYAKPVPNGYHTVHIHSLRTGRSFPVSDGLHDDREPRWDPAGRYLYFISRRHLDPILDEMDLEHVFASADEICAVPLARDTPPPLPEIARAAGFDLEAWAKPPPAETGAEGDEVEGDAGAGEDAEGAAAPPGAAAIQVDTDGIAERQWRLPVEPGNYGGLEAIRGGVTWLSTPLAGLLEEEKQETPGGGLAQGVATLHRCDLAGESSSVLARGISGYALSADGTTIAHPVREGFAVVDLEAPAGPDGPGEPEIIDLSEVRLRVDVQAEWRQIFEEAWRLQRDFYWAPNFAGVDWPAMKTRYAALLPRVGTREELNDLIGQMIGELGTSHAYVFGGEAWDRPEPVEVGMLGADVEIDPQTGAFRIRRILPRLSWDEELESPLAAPHLGVAEGDLLLAVNGVALGFQSNIHDLLQDQAGKVVRLTVARAAAPREKRVIEVRALESERPLRYAAWVEANRRRVEEASQGKVGYLHLPDMAGEGLAAFGRMFQAQIEKKALVVDVRGNSGGFVSQMIIERLNRKVWAFMKPRHGMMERFPSRSLHGHLAVLIDEHAGSDGDVFPESFRLLGLGPLIGTRTWGGVVGVRGDKPFVDLGLSTQPEFAWWEPKRGWSLENEGVRPDIEVQITPADRLAGRDPQLDKAVEVLLEKLRQDPRELPAPPPWPDKGAPR